MHNFVLEKLQAIHRTFRRIGRNLKEKQVAGYLHKQSPRLNVQRTKSFALSLSYHCGYNFQFRNGWKGPWFLENFFRNVIFRIKDEYSSKQQSIRYDQLKPFHEPPSTPSVPTCNNPRRSQSPQHIDNRHKHIDGAPKLDDCFGFSTATFGVLKSTSPIGGTVSSIPIGRHTPITSYAPAGREEPRSPPMFTWSPVQEPPSPLTVNDVAISIKDTPQTEIQPPMSKNAFLHRRQPPCDNATEHVETAARSLRKTPPANTSTKDLRSKTST